MNETTPSPHYSFDEIAAEFVKYAPAYAQEEAKEAIRRVQELQFQGVIRNGVYYIVLVDLVGSTKYAATHGNDALANRVQQFVISSFSALNETHLKNIGLFLKEIGDAVLFIFQHFPDVIRWKVEFDKWLAIFDEEEPLDVRVCVHLGEVYLDGVNPLSIAVSQAFKMEKKVQTGHVVLTDPAYCVAWPTIARAYHGFEDYDTVDLDGFASPVKLHRLVVHDANDTKRIVDESID
jgi:class 3 adenylate cyclase